MFGFKFTKFQPNEYVIQYRNGAVIREGAGLSFYYYAPVTSLVKLPLKSMEIPFIFEEVSEDFQSLTVQGQVTFRIVDYKKVANLLNYSIDVKRHGYLSDDPEKLAQRVINLVHVLTKKSLERRKITEAIKQSELIAVEILKDIKANEEIVQLGIEILSLSILGIKPNKDTARALEAKAREEILKQADDAIYQRRNASIEQERIVKENEFNTEIAVENKRKQVKETQLEAKKAIQLKMNQMESENLAFAIAQEEKKSELIERSVANEKAKADSKAYELKAMMDSLQGMDAGVIASMANMGMKPDKLMALAFQQLAGNAEKIGQLTITPDLLSEITRGGNSE